MPTADNIANRLNTYGGMIIPLDELPGPLQAVAELLPAAALSEVFHGSFSGDSVSTQSLVVLAVWAVAAPVLAARFFRWE